MLFIYFLIIILIGIFILRMFITKRKRNVVKLKEDIQNKVQLKEISITESVPYYKYTKHLKIDIINLNAGDSINTNEMFYIEEGSITISHNGKFVCQKQQTDFYFYALGYFDINLENLHIHADEKSRIWKLKTSSINKFIFLISLKKKVLEVMSQHLKFVSLFLDNEIILSNTFQSESLDSKYKFQYFIVNYLKFTKNCLSNIRILRLKKDEIYKKKDDFMDSLIFIEEGNLQIKHKEKIYLLEKGSIFGYFNLFFNCYRDIEIYSTSETNLRIISYNFLHKHGIDMHNFNIKLLKNFGNLIHYVDLCSDWRIFRIEDVIENKKYKELIFLNEGSIQKKGDFLIVKRLSDIVFIKEDLISHILRYDVNSYKEIFRNKDLIGNNKIVSIVPNNKNTNINLFSKRLKSSIGKECVLLDKKDFFLSFDISEELRVSEFLNRMSKTNGIILINIENKYSRLARFLHEISDVVLVVGYNWEDEINESAVERIYKGTKKGIFLEDKEATYKFENVEYVRLYENKENIKTRDCDNEYQKFLKMHHVLSPSKTILFSTKDYDRLGRYLMGRRIGLVLSGGGARGIAHIGIIQALEEENVPIDIIGGSSMGAFVGALYCKECDNGFVFLQTKKFCLKAKSLWTILYDLTYPFMSLFRGEALNRSLKKIFKADLIQNMWIDYFCITTNLFTSEEEVHTSGLAPKYIRASMGLCGYVPPIVDSKGYLVDGGYLNNVPADVMLNMNVSKIIAVDVGTIEDNDYDEHDECLNGFVALVHKFFGVRKYITMEEIQYRLSFLTSEKKLKDLENNNQVFVMRPELGDIHTMDFKRFDEIVASGYSSAKKIIKEWKANGIFEKHLDQKKFRNLRRRYSV